MLLLGPDDDARGAGREAPGGNLAQGTKLGRAGPASINCEVIEYTEKTVLLQFKNLHLC